MGNMLCHRFTEIPNNIHKHAFPSTLSTQTSEVPVWIEASYGRRSFARMLLHHVSTVDQNGQSKLKYKPSPDTTTWGRQILHAGLCGLENLSVWFVSVRFILHFYVVMDCSLILARKLLGYSYHIYPQNANEPIAQVMSFIWRHNATKYLKTLCLITCHHYSFHSDTRAITVQSYWCSWDCSRNPIKM